MSFGCVSTTNIPLNLDAKEANYLSAFQERVNEYLSLYEEEKGDSFPLHNSRFETSVSSLLRILRRTSHNIEMAFKEWREWVSWRRVNKANDATEEVIRLNFIFHLFIDVLLIHIMS